MADCAKVLKKSRTNRVGIVSLVNGRSRIKNKNGFLKYMKIASVISFQLSIGVLKNMSF